ncbi:NAD(P)H-binding protein [Streptomyces rubradiris]|uniref:Nucleotide-diphosphate-sugar epimerase n=2 Tax=Streptomyces rubradiris TaxID=285531 RepID=Q2PC45_STRRR|nr:NAD(P)H-binding protein [Streptomyces rubradiris]GHH30416.1 nucleotide-diphosphate-sugar epimerase [Streptomyces rubradiris]GHI52868.1 nucleotide-diphosphate-sugar epimerase [Streptomyces rubradiris]GHI58171.1 nucleotide-diphosphate-sugar epimerase [Streptomyces rubradiris]CAI94723.1 putative hydroxylase [Streptomyces rubradiris]
MSVLVTGAYGDVGSHVVAGLLSAGVPVRGTSRTPRTGESPDGVEMVRLDLDEPETWPAALDGVKKVFLYAHADRVADFAGAARAAGVEHIVLLSSAAVVDPATRHSRSAVMHSAVEEALRESGIAWTFLRPTTFATKQLHLAPAIRSGEVLRIPFLQAPTASIHERDIADAAVCALTGAGHEGKGYWLTGPQALTQQEHIEVIAAVTGRPIEVVDLAPEDAEPKLPEFFIRIMTELMNNPCVVTPAVEEITGVPARSFRQWAEDHIKDFS